MYNKTSVFALCVVISNRYTIFTNIFETWLIYEIRLCGGFYSQRALSCTVLVSLKYYFIKDITLWNGYMQGIIFSNDPPPSQVYTSSKMVLQRICFCGNGLQRKIFCGTHSFTCTSFFWKCLHLHPPQIDSQHDRIQLTRGMCLEYMFVKQSKYDVMHCTKWYDPFRTLLFNNTIKGPYSCHD